MKDAFKKHSEKRDASIRKACRIAGKGLRKAIKYLCKRHGKGLAKDGQEAYNEAYFVQCLFRDEVVTNLRIYFLEEQARACPKLKKR